MPAGLAGLMLAAIFAASMSSMDSAIHAMSTATLVDFVRPLRRRAQSDRDDLVLARVLTGVFGVLAILAALVAAGQGDLMLRQLLRWLGYVAGPLLGLFLLGLLTRGANERGALIGTAAGGLVIVTAMVFHLPAAWGMAPLWFAPVALSVTVLVGRLTSVGAAVGPQRTRGLTWWTRR
jgi:SSS family solute:Na+ symporter